MGNGGLNMTAESDDARLARIETKLDQVLTILPDHEMRLRTVEQYREDCQQVLRLNKIETRIDGHDTDIADLKATHQQDTGFKLATLSLREWGLAAIAVIGFGIAYFKGA